MAARSVSTKNNVVEALHGSVKLELQLACILLTELLRRLHRAHLIDPIGHRLQTLVVRRHVRIVCQCLLHVSESGQKLIHRSDVKSQNIGRRNELGGNVEDALRQVPIRLLTLVIRLACLEDSQGRLAVLNVVHGHELVQTGEVVDRLRAQLVLVQQGAELVVVLCTLHLAIHVSELLQ